MCTRTNNSAKLYIPRFLRVFNELLCIAKIKSERLLIGYASQNYLIMKTPVLRAFRRINGSHNGFGDLLCNSSLE